MSIFLGVLIVTFVFPQPASGKMPENQGSDNSMLIHK